MTGIKAGAEAGVWTSAGKNWRIPVIMLRTDRGRSLWRPLSAKNVVLWVSKPQNDPKIDQNGRFFPKKSPFHSCSTEWPWSPLFHDLFYKVGPATPYCTCWFLNTPQCPVMVANGVFFNWQMQLHSTIFRDIPCEAKETKQSNTHPSSFRPRCS